MNQAWVGAGSVWPNSAVPVLPQTTPGKWTLAAVPSVTTERMRVRRVAIMLWSSGFAAALPVPFPDADPVPVLGLVRCGGRQVPSATAAATVAICSGLASTRPCPNADAARSARSRGAGYWPWTAGTPGDRSSPKPNWLAAAASLSPVRRVAASCTKAVLHDSAKAVPNEIDPAFSFSKFLKERPPTLAVAGQLT